MTTDLNLLVSVVLHELYVLTVLVVPDVLLMEEEPVEREKSLTECCVH